MLAINNQSNNLHFTSINHDPQFAKIDNPPCACQNFIVEKTLWKKLSFFPNFPHLAHV